MMLPQNCRQSAMLLALLPALLIAGCATRSTISTGASMELPEKPPLQQPEPSEPYSKRASRNIETWRTQLTDIWSTQELANRLGQSEEGNQ